MESPWGVGNDAVKGNVANKGDLLNQHYSGCLELDTEGRLWEIMQNTKLRGQEVGQLTAY